VGGRKTVIREKMTVSFAFLQYTKSVFLSLELINNIDSSTHPNSCWALWWRQACPHRRWPSSGWSWKRQRIVSRNWQQYWYLYIYTFRLPLHSSKQSRVFFPGEGGVNKGWKFPLEGRGEVKNGPQLTPISVLIEEVAASMEMPVE
jgi:hypothetical protein